MSICRSPTHTLVIEVPLCLEDRETARFDPVQDALRIALSLSRLASEGFYCGNAQASIRDEPVVHGQSTN